MSQTSDEVDRYIHLRNANVLQNSSGSLVRAEHVRRCRGEYVMARFSRLLRSSESNSRKADAPH
jgi:hypothetical protein